MVALLGGVGDSSVPTPPSPCLEGTCPAAHGIRAEPKVAGRQPHHAPMLPMPPDDLISARGFRSGLGREPCQARRSRQAVTGSVGDHPVNSHRYSSIASCHFPCLLTDIYLTLIRTHRQTGLMPYADNVEVLVTGALTGQFQ